MQSKSVHVALIFIFATVLWLTWSSQKVTAGILNKPASTILYSQAPHPSGGLVASSLLAPSGTQDDRYIWDNFTLGSTNAITEIDWIGGYDPAYSDAGGPVIDFTVAVYGSITGGTQPNVVDPPLGAFQTGGNAGETLYGTMGGIPLYNYQYVLPSPVLVAAGNVYWVQIEAWQYGTRPDWGMSVGNSGDGWHFLKIPRGLGYIYQFAPNDVAFTLRGELAYYQLFFPLVEK